MSTPCEDADAATEALTAAIAGPREVEADGLSVRQHSLPDLIEAERYQAAKCAATRPGRGLRLTKLIPGGTA